MRWTFSALATHACLQTDCVKLPLSQHQMVWCCLTWDVFTRLGYFSAFGRIIGCPWQSPLHTKEDLLVVRESLSGSGLPLGSVFEVGALPPMWRRKQSYTQNIMSCVASPRVFSQDRTTTTPCLTSGTEAVFKSRLRTTIWALPATFL